MWKKKIVWEFDRNVTNVINQFRSIFCCTKRNNVSCMQEDYNDREECKILKQGKGANQQTRQRETKARQKKLTHVKFSETSMCVTLLNS